MFFCGVPEVVLALYLAGFLETPVEYLRMMTFIDRSKASKVNKAFESLRKLDLANRRRFHRICLEEAAASATD